MVFGVGLCVGWQFNVVATLTDAVPAFDDSVRLDGLSGEILSGLSVGAMAGFWHEKLDQWSSAAKKSRGEAVESQAKAVEDIVQARMAAGQAGR